MLAETRTRIRRGLRGIRLRVLVWYVLLFAASLIVALLTIRQVLLTQLEDDVSAELAQEVEELQLLSTGVDPLTGQPFGDDVAALFRTFLDRNVPAEGELLLTILGGEITGSSPEIIARPLLDTDLPATWAATTEPTWGETDIDGVGSVRWLSVPVQVSSGETAGFFVVANRIGEERQDIDQAVRTMAAVSTGVLVVASILGWATAGRVLAPLRRVTTTARRISDEDLSERIPVDGHDEVAVLTDTFNQMLDRLEGAFAGQRAFLDRLGHELRTPITIVQGHLELLPDDPDERREAIAVCLDELDRMRRDVNDLVTLAKAGRPDFLTPAVVDVAELTDGLERRAAGFEPDRRWVIEEVAPATVWGDASRLTQAMVNLVANAVQHTEPGDEIRLGSSLRDGEVRLWVSDPGPGIALEDRERIFGWWGRGAPAQARRSEGTGLGLAIVSAIAAAHGGRVDLDTVVGRGSTFTLVLPGGHATLDDDTDDDDLAGTGPSDGAVRLADGRDPGRPAPTPTERE